VGGGGGGGGVQRGAARILLGLEPHLTDHHQWGMGEYCSDIIDITLIVFLDLG